MKTNRSRFWQIVFTLAVVGLLFIGNSRFTMGHEGASSIGTEVSPRLVEYLIVSDPDWNSFQTQMNAKLAQGYTPVGGIAITSEGNPMQAIVR